MSETTYIAHEDPVGRGAENYIAMVDLEPFGFEKMCEQIWLSTRTGGGYEVACIPLVRMGWLSEMSWKSVTPGSWREWSSDPGDEFSGCSSWSPARVMTLALC
ncbi:hypothetical protein [Streptomyces mexicanus]|uniref:Uncharacterized protein n=1 Tax=Streptomyces mexicanus TaxID=178566 RepID=A0A7X1I5L3_9ACTN|nr:hypothetical protein [Streptomyces mexicanus]MBC2869147.1 hypothetical protein [Streptomyces mexicanus]